MMMLPRSPRSLGYCLLAACVSVASTAIPAVAQTAPFDMAPELGETTKPVAPVPDVNAPAVAPEINLAFPTVTDSATSWRRYIVPSDMLSLKGEQDQHSWNIVLTAEEANAPARLNLGYQSAILVAPESSSFSVSLNNVKVLKQTIESSDQLAEIMVDIPAGVLKAGANTITIRAEQRHRTDCTVESTYELWTNIDPSKTYLSFSLSPMSLANPSAGKRFAVSEDISAIGVDQKGSTHFNLIVPGLGNEDNGISILNLSQALAILGNMPNQSFSIEKRLHPTLIHQDGARSGELTVLVGTAAELTPVFNDLRVSPNGDGTASMRFISNAETGEQFVLISGENWREIDRNIQQLVSMTERPANSKRSTLQTQNWNLPDTQLLRDATTLTFSELGIATQQFSGRRVRNQFTIGVPADFYADAYGWATILLDAAYSAEVQPGSHLDIYVNDNIATTVPITSGGGGIMKQLPIKVTMNHFRPGLNTITIEAVLMTNADAVCTPGTASSNTPRFALFDTSKFRMPSFGRIGQTPNLAATAGMAYPYSYATDEIPLFTDMNDYNVLSASATVMGNLAIAVGRPLKIKLGATQNDLKNGNALFIGAISNISPAVLTQAGINPEARGIWSDDDAAKTVQGSQNYTLNEWKMQLQSDWYARLENFFLKMQDTFNLSRNGLRLFPGKDTLFIPSKAISVVVAQGASPTAKGAWTVVTAQDTVQLRQGVENLVQQSNWTQLDGRISAFNRESQTVELISAHDVQYLVTQPFSFTNVRLIATNWLSSNALSYVAVMLISLVALGLSTSSLLARFGRREDDK